MFMFRMQQYTSTSSSVSEFFEREGWDFICRKHKTKSKNAPIVAIFEFKNANILTKPL